MALKTDGENPTLSGTFQDKWEPCSKQKQIYQVNSRNLVYLIFDVACTISIFQSVQRLDKVAVRWRYTSNHCSVAVYNTT